MRTVTFTIMGDACATASCNKPQPQGHVQTFLNMAEFGMDSQEALDAPRFCIPSGTAKGTICLEHGITPEVVDELRRRGHDVWDPW